jgi:hypothetical protein
MGLFGLSYGDLGFMVFVLGFNLKVVLVVCLLGFVAEPGREFLQLLETNSFESGICGGCFEGGRIVMKGLNYGDFETGLRGLGLLRLKIQISSLYSASICIVLPYPSRILSNESKSS